MNMFEVMDIILSAAAGVAPEDGLAVACVLIENCAKRMGKTAQEVAAMLTDLIGEVNKECGEIEEVYEPTCRFRKVGA